MSFEGWGVSLIQDPVSVSPAESVGHLLRQGHRIEGLEENGGNAKACKSLLIRSLDLGSEQDDGNVCCLRAFLQLKKCGGTIHAGHHYVQQDRIGLLCLRS